MVTEKRKNGTKERKRKLEQIKYILFFKACQKAKKFEVIEKSLKVICMIMMHSFYIKLFFSQTLVQLKLFLFTCKNEIYSTCWYSCTAPFTMKTLNTSDLDSHVWICLSLYLQIFKSDLANLLQRGTRSRWAVLHATLQILNCDPAFLTSSHSICRPCLQCKLPQDVVQLVTHYFTQMISFAEQIPIISACFWWCQTWLHILFVFKEEYFYRTKITSNFSE